MPVQKKDVVKELKIYSDGSVEDATASKKEEKRLFDAPALPDWATKLLGVTLLLAGVGLAYYVLVQKKPLSQLPADITAAVSGGGMAVSAAPAPVKRGVRYGSPVPQPMVGIDEFAMPMYFSGRSIG